MNKISIIWQNNDRCHVDSISNIDDLRKFELLEVRYWLDTLGVVVTLSTR